MKLWKNNISKSLLKNNIKIKRLSIKSLELNKNNSINKINNGINEKSNLINKKIKELNEKSNDGIIELVHNNKNSSFCSSSDEEKNLTKNSNLKQTRKIENLFRNKNKKFQNILITTFPTGNQQKSKSKKINNIKSIFPKINPENKFFKSVSTFGFNKNRKKAYKFKNSFSPLQYNNTILNKWREDFHKIFVKTIKKTKADFSITYHKFYRNKNKVKKKFEKKVAKKLIIKSISVKDKQKFSNKSIIFEANDKINNNTTENNKIEILTNKDYKNNEINPEIKKNLIKRRLSIETSSLPSSPMKPNNYPKSPKKKYLYSNEQYSVPSSFSSKSLNKFDYSQTNIKLYKNYKRKRNYYDYMKESNILNLEWKKKIGLLDAELKYSKSLLTDLHFQSNTIKDEMNLLVDSIHYYKMRIFGNSELITAFMNKDILFQINVNKSIEETCALLHLIPKIILKEYYMYSDRFISIAEPGRENFITKIITNESECLNENIKLLYKIINFVKSAFEVYTQLVRQVEEEMIIPQHDFELLRAIFQKTRYFIGNLINFGNNILKDYTFDKKLVRKCKPILDHTKERLKYDWRLDTNINNFINNNNKNTKNKRNQTYFNLKIKRNRNSDSIYSKMHSNINFVDNDLYQKILRITKALETGEDPKKIQNNYADELKIKQAGVGNRNGPMALIYSPLMTKMLKYIRKDIREKIISLRSSEKFIESKEE